MHDKGENKNQSKKARRKSKKTYGENKMDNRTNGSNKKPPLVLRRSKRNKITVQPIRKTDENNKTIGRINGNRREPQNAENNYHKHKGITSMFRR